MKAAAAFVAGLRERLAEVDRVRTTVFGSLAWTGKGHSSDKAIALGFAVSTLKRSIRSVPTQLSRRSMSKERSISVAAAT